MDRWFPGQTGGSSRAETRQLQWQALASRLDRLAYGLVTSVQWRGADYYGLGDPNVCPVSFWRVFCVLLCVQVCNLRFCMDRNGPGGLQSRTPGRVDRPGQAPSV